MAISWRGCVLPRLASTERPENLCPRLPRIRNCRASFERLPPDHPGGFFRRDEARRLDVLEPAVVVVALQVAAAAAAGGADRAAVLLRDRPVDLERAELGAAV